MLTKINDLRPLDVNAKKILLLNQTKLELN